MKNIESLFNILLVGKSFCKEAALGRILSKATGLIILIIISGTIMGSLLVFTLYLIYTGMLQSGIDAPAALYTMSGIVLLFMIIFVTLTLISVNNLRNLLRLKTKPKSDLGKIIEAFKDGLLNK